LITGDVAHLFVKSRRDRWGNGEDEDMVRGERERRFNRRLTRLWQRVHIPYRSKRLYAPHLFPHPQTSRRIICACSGLVGTTANRKTWLTKKI